MAENVGGTQGHEQELVSVGDLKATLQKYKSEISDEKYVKPNSGVPLNDMSQGVKDSLGNADSAAQQVKIGDGSPISPVGGVVTLPDYYSKSQINTLLSGIDQFQSIKVQTLPTASAETTNKIYFAPTGENGKYESYITAKADNNGTITYEMVKINLTDIYTKDELDALLAAMANAAVVVQTQNAVSILPNMLNIWLTPVAALTLSFTVGTSGIVNEYMIQFTCPSNAATELTLPSSVKWANGQDLEPEPGYTYQISVVNNLAVYAGWEA